MKKTLSIIICTLLAGALATAIIASPKKKKTEDKPLRLLYWNIQNGMWSEQGEANYNNFVAWVKEQDPDICVWCEAESNYETAGERHLTKEEKHLPGAWPELASRYGHDFVYIGGHHDRFPQCITSRYPIKNVDRLLGNEDTVVFHGAGWARLKINGKTLNIVTTHTYPQSYGVGVTGAAEQKASSARFEGSIYRAKEMEYICKHTIESVPEAASQYWLMCGDFNEISSAENYYYKLDRNCPCFLLHDYIADNTPYIDALAVKNPKNFVHSNGRKTRRIDFVYVTRPLYDNIENIELIWDDYTTPVKDETVKKNFWHPSDHLPIIMDFRL